MRGASSLVLSLLVPALLVSSVALGSAIFESAPVHPLELSPDGTRLLAVNTDDHRLVVYDLTLGEEPRVEAEIMVGVEPVTVRFRTNTEVWVVNHISDSISIIDLTTMNVVKTILTADEPTDVVFAGTPEKAFVSASQEDLIQVFNAANPDTSTNDIPLDGSDPRALTVSPDGTKIYAIVLDSGNQTTVVHEDTVANSLGLPLPDPPIVDTTLIPPPDVSLIVRHDGSNWVDELSRSWDFAVTYTMPDNDVIEIDVVTEAVTDSFSGVGTNLFNIIAHPTTGKLFITNQEALNEIRFEPNLRGRFAKSQLTLVDPVGDTVTPVHLNPHIDAAGDSVGGADPNLSIAFPLDLTMDAEGDSIYACGFSSAKVFLLDGTGTVLERIDVGDGPCGVVVDESRRRLYVLNKTDETLSAVNLDNFLSSLTFNLGFTPLSDAQRKGRRLFYDAVNSSLDGNLTCATCHLFGNTDGLVWDLGNPQGMFQPPPPSQPGSDGFHPMKGPLFTQSLRNMSNSEPFHWRGDNANLNKFNPTFVNLIGRDATLDPLDFNDVQSFLLSILYPPNPLRNLDGTLPNPVSGPNPTNGEAIFLSDPIFQGGAACVVCHNLPTGESGAIINSATLGETQDFVVPQVRNMYEKTRFTPESATSIRGFGFTHDGTHPTMFSFLSEPIFQFVNDDDKRDVESFLLHFDSGTHAAVGTQWTMDGTNETEGLVTLNTLLTLADANDIGLVAKGLSAGERRGWEYLGLDFWKPDRAMEDSVDTATLLAIAGSGTEITFTAVVEGCEHRLGVDRDEDTYSDQDERDAGSNPGNPASTPANVAVADIPGVGPTALLEQAFPNPALSGASRLAFTLDRSGPVRLDVFDVQGRLVRTLVDDPRHPAGRYERTWDLQDGAGRRVSGGLYFVKLVTEAGSWGTRLVVVQ